MADIKIFSGNSNLELSKKISDHLQLPISKAKVARFSDGEITVEINENVRGRDTYIIQSTSAPANDNLMELIIMADALRRASAKSITAVIPYFGYGRQDRRPRSARVPITAKIVADMLNKVGINHVITVDLHADQIQGFFYIPVDNVYATPIMIDDMNTQEYNKNVTVVSPDVGGVVRARAVAKKLNDADLAIIDKRRPAPNEAVVMNIIGDVKDRTCLIVDDIVDTAGTLCKAANALKANGAKNVIAYCTHAVLSGNAINNIDESALDEVVVCDTIKLNENAQSSSKIRQLSLSHMIAETIYRVNHKKSVSSMFEE